MYLPNNPAAFPKYLLWKGKIHHTMYSKPTQSRRSSDNYADSVAQTFFVNTAIINNLHPPNIEAELRPCKLSELSLELAPLQPIFQTHFQHFTSSPNKRN